MRRTLRRQWPVLVLGVAALVVLSLSVVAEIFRDETPSYSTTNYSLIEDGLYLGGHLGEAPPGTRAVLNVCEHQDCYEAEVHRWQPIPDAAPAPGLDWLRSQVEFVAQQRRAGLPVFVHCAAGISRSVLVVTAYFMARDGCGRDEALARIRAKRPGVGPNAAFMRLLLEWEETLKKPRTGACTCQSPRAA